MNAVAAFASRPFVLFVIARSGYLDARASRAANCRHCCAISSEQAIGRRDDDRPGSRAIGFQPEAGVLNDGRPLHRQKHLSGTGIADGNPTGGIAEDRIRHEHAGPGRRVHVDIYGVLNEAEDRAMLDVQRAAGQKLILFRPPLGVPARPLILRFRRVTTAVAGAETTIPLVPATSTDATWPPPPSIVMAFVIVTAPKPPGSRALISPPAAVWTSPCKGS